MDRRSVSDSQADSAGSIPVTHSTRETRCPTYESGAISHLERRPSASEISTRAIAECHYRVPLTILASAVARPHRRAGSCSWRPTSRDHRARCASCRTDANGNRHRAGFKEQHFRRPSLYVRRYPMTFLSGLTLMLADERTRGQGLTGDRRRGDPGCHVDASRGPMRRPAGHSRRLRARPRSQ